MNRFRSIFGLASATQYLVLANLIVYAIQVINLTQYGPEAVQQCLFSGGCVTPLEKMFALITPPHLPNVLWQLVTYMFFHGSLWHILFNMIFLWSLGRSLEHVWSLREFSLYCFFMGIGAGLTTIGVSLVTGEHSISVGASGAIFGLLLAFGLLFPNQNIILFPIPLPIPAKYAVLILGGFAVFAKLTGFLPVIGHIAHLGGILFGFLYLKGWRLLGRYVRR